MTDHEIIKALGRCPYQRDCVSCDVNACDNSPNHIMKCALSLINRQKAEIERLKAESAMADGYADALEERAKAEAIKEFAERLETVFDEIESNLPENHLVDKTARIFIDAFQLIKKEMVGEDNSPIVDKRK